jgi:hypothetical protein
MMAVSACPSDFREEVVIADEEDRAFHPLQSILATFLQVDRFLLLVGES